jgi:hypothetical protein
VHCQKSQRAREFVLSARSAQSASLNGGDKAEQEVPMKKRVLLAAFSFLFLVMAATQVAVAQQAMVVNIPFDFTVDKMTLPAGEYYVESSTPQALILRQHAKPSASVIVTAIATQALEPSSESKLVFNRYGDRYFLAQLWTAGNSADRQLLKSRGEQESEKTARIETRSYVTLVARLAAPKP